MEPSIRKALSKKAAKAAKLYDQMVKEGINILGRYWTLCRYDSVMIMEAKDEKTAMKALLRFSDRVSTETLVAVTKEEAIRLIE